MSPKSSEPRMNPPNERSALWRSSSASLRSSGERAGETLPDRVPVDEHDERDDEDEGRVEQHGGGRRDDAQRVVRDRPGDLAQTARHGAVELGHLHGYARALQLDLETGGLARRAVAVLGGA